MSPTRVTLVSVVLLLLLLQGTTSKKLLNTHGVGSGELCGGKRFCVSGESTCIENRCLCESGNGNGELVCFNGDTVSGGIFSDPEVSSFADEGFIVETPCRYLVTHVLTDLHDPAEKGGKCGVKVYSYNKRVKGKWFVSGVDVSVHKIPHHPAGENSAEMPRPLMVRMSGYAMNGTYSFQAWSKRGDKIDSWEETDIPNVFEEGIALTADRKNNRVIFSAKQCGFKITYRPADESLGIHQTMVPGFFLSFDNKFNPKWESLDQATLLPPTPHLPHHLIKLLPPLSVNTVAHRLHMHKNDAFLYKALTAHHVDQDFPWAPKSCPALIHEAKKCVWSYRRPEAFKECSFILTSPKFVRCWSGSEELSEGVLGLFGDCLHAFCQECVDKCHSVKKQLSTGACALHVPGKLKDFDCMTLYYN